MTRSRLALGLLLGWLSLCHGAAAFAEPRAAQVAGAFYPGDADALRSMVARFLEGAPVPPADSAPPRILISPHAGYLYSGPIAAAAFRQVQGRAYDGVVVVGFTHRDQFSGSSVDDREAYTTPLGSIPTDRTAIDFLLTRPRIQHVERAHDQQEHSVEVMLPFLQIALGSFRLVPIMMGSIDPADASALADALAELSRRGNYLFVFSSDLSHYHPYDEARQRDDITVNAVLSETGQAVERLFEAGQLEACGRGPIVTALLLARRLGDPARRLVTYANSGDTAGDKSRVVGYAAIAMVERPDASGADQLSDTAGMALVRAAREVITAQVHGTAPPAALPTDQLPELAATRGIFVTLRKHGQLRGCIGRIEGDRPLAALLPIVAREAALNDHRFSPMTADELPAIHIEVSILSPARAVAAPGDIVAGRDGVVLMKDERSGVFLPQVWEETGWTRVEFLRELASQKAGLEPDAWRQAKLLTFRDQSFEEPSDIVATH